MLIHSAPAYGVLFLTQQQKDSNIFYVKDITKIFYTHFTSCVGVFYILYNKNYPTAQKKLQTSIIIWYHFTILDAVLMEA